LLDCIKEGKQQEVKVEKGEKMERSPGPPLRNMGAVVLGFFITNTLKKYAKKTSF
jgi:hypothetical protein